MGPAGGQTGESLQVAVLPNRDGLRSVPELERQDGKTQPDFLARLAADNEGFPLFCCKKW